MEKRARNLILVTAPSRSGKSEWAEHLAEAIAMEKNKSRHYSEPAGFVIDRKNDRGNFAQSLINMGFP